MIRTFADDATRDIWNGVNTKMARRIPKDLWAVVRRKLDQIDSVSTLEALKVPPVRMPSTFDARTITEERDHAADTSLTNASRRDAHEGIP